jgi:predicted DNA-binding ribbon-helix-helix protein
MKSSIVKRSIVVDGHNTSVSLEDEFWNSLREIAKERGESLTHVVGSIDANRDVANLSSAIRLFILRFYKEQLHKLNVEISSQGLATSSLQ